VKRGAVRKWLPLALIPALLLAGDFVYWRLAVRRLRAEFEYWAGGTRSSGWEIHHGAVTAGGWPDSASLRIANLTVRASGLPGRDAPAGFPVAGLEWGSDAVLVRAGLARPDTLDITPFGLHALRLNGGPAIPISADHIHLRLTSHRKTPPRSLDIEAVTLVASIPGFGAVKFGDLSGHAELRPASGRDQPVVAFAVAARPLILPEDAHWGLGPEIDEIALEGVLNGPVLGRPNAVEDLTERATTWRDDGGSLELHRIAIAWGQARLDGTATLALDEDLQPMGAGSTRIVGYAAALDALAASAVLTRSAARAAKAVLSLLGNTPDDGQPEEVEVPLTLQFRTLSVRQVPLVRLPELDWPRR
jgi:hypothetical protein